MTSCLEAGVKLHQYLATHHWREKTLIGPDPGIRFDYRIGRFIKSYLHGVNWGDDHYYLQAQGYWVLGNWSLFTWTDKEIYREIALGCSARMLAEQREDGSWDYPHPEWKGRVATIEGTWGSLGLLETYRQTSDLKFLVGALRWHKFLIETIGFQRMDDELAVNYFANRSRLRVPNNSACVLRFLAALADATRNEAYLQPCVGLLTFLQGAQKATGEFPYAVEGLEGGHDRPHFQCYQYNAFQCLDLIRYYEITGDTTSRPLIAGILGFLRQGIAEEGWAFYECDNRYRQVTYHTAAIGAAFAAAKSVGIDGYDELTDRAYTYLLGEQQSDGAFLYSRGDYYLFHDRRAYPRYLAMMLYHLLLVEPIISRDITRKEEAHLAR